MRRLLGLLLALVLLGAGAGVGYTLLRDTGPVADAELLFWQRLEFEEPGLRHGGRELYDDDRRFEGHELPPLDDEHRRFGFVVTGCQEQEAPELTVVGGLLWAEFPEGGSEVSCGAPEHYVAVFDLSRSAHRPFVGVYLDLAARQPFTADLGPVTITWRDRATQQDPPRDKVFTQTRDDCRYTEVVTRVGLLGVADEPCEEYGEPSRFVPDGSEIAFLDGSDPTVSVPITKVRSEWSRCTNECPGYVQEYVVYGFRLGPDDVRAYLVINVDEGEPDPDLAARQLLDTVEATGE